MSGRDQGRRSRVGRAAASAVLASCALSPCAFADQLDPNSRADNYADVWLRLDLDRSALQAWVGGTKSWAGLDLGADLVLTQYYPGAWDPLQNDAFNLSLDDQTRAPALRVEIGPAFVFGGLFIQPKLGLGYDFELERIAPFVPQATFVFEVAFVYLEAWVQFFLYGPFEPAAQDSFHTRDSVLFAFDGRLALGVEGDFTVGLRNSGGDTLRSSQLGLLATANPVGTLTLGVFVGAETESRTPYRFPVGRVTGTVLF
jgi:hypothetical protein